MLPRLPLFPLSAVLFPGTTLPLHIFEPRYRRMLADCMAGDRRFGITPPGGEQETPDPGMVGCIAEVQVSQELPDGRSNIVVAGGLRFVVRRVLADAAPYYVAMVETFDDDEGTTPAGDRTAQLRVSFLRYLELVRHLNDMEPEEPELPADPLGLSFYAAAGAECEPALKQRLLAERSTARRVDALLLLLPALATAVEKALLVHRRAHSNGRGGGTLSGGGSGGGGGTHPVLPEGL
jgi:Lon protease-like protein